MTMRSCFLLCFYSAFENGGFSMKYFHKIQSGKKQRIYYMTAVFIVEFVMPVTEKPFER